MKKDFWKKCFSPKFSPFRIKNEIFKLSGNFFVNRTRYQNFQRMYNKWKYFEKKHDFMRKFRVYFENISEKNDEMLFGSFLLTPSPLHWFHSPSHTVTDMRNNKRRHVLTHARVNLSQSETPETRSLLCMGLNYELLLWGGGDLTENILLF